MPAAFRSAMRHETRAERRPRTRGALLTSHSALKAPRVIRRPHREPRGPGFIPRCGNRGAPPRTLRALPRCKPLTFAAAGGRMGVGGHFATAMSCGPRKRPRSDVDRDSDGQRRTRGHGVDLRPALAGVVDLDLLAAHRVGDLLLFHARVLVEADALLRNRALLDDRLLLVEHHLVLLLGDRRTAHGVADVAVGDRLALDADLLAADGNGLRDLVLDDVLPQAHAARLALGGPAALPLLGAGHRVVGGGAADVAAHGIAVARGCVPAVGQAGVGACLRVLEAVVLVERGL